MIDLAVCGLGRWGQRLVESVQNVSKEVRFTRAVSRDPAQTPGFAKLAGLRVTASYADVLEDPSIAGVVLATPHSHHHGEILAAVKAGKHVFVEKPITLTRHDTEEAVAAVGRAGLALGIGFGRRFTPAYVELARRVRAGVIGDILHIEGNSSGPSGYRLPVDNWRSNRIESPAGAMTARGIHALDVMISLAGPVTSVFCRSERRVIAPAIDDTTTASLCFAGGATGHLTTIFATGDIWRVQVYGTKGWLEMDGNETLIQRDNAGPATTVVFDAIDKERLALEAFARAIVGKAPFPVQPGEVINGIAVLEAMVASADSGAAVAVQP